MTGYKNRPQYGQWLREQRQARGWNVPEMARQLRDAARQTGDQIPDPKAVSVMIHRWEHDGSGVSERYRLHYCRALGIPPAAFGKSPSELHHPDPAGPADVALALAEKAMTLLAESIAALRSAT